MDVHVVDEAWLSYELGIAPVPETSEYGPPRSQDPELRIGTISDRALKAISENSVRRSQIEKHNPSNVPPTQPRAAKELVYKSKKDGEWHTLVQHSSKEGCEVELKLVKMGKHYGTCVQERTATTSPEPLYTFFDRLDKAKEDFQTKFKYYTGLEWEHRNKHPVQGKYIYNQDF